MATQPLFLHKISVVCVYLYIAATTSDPVGRDLRHLSIVQNVLSCVPKYKKTVICLPKKIDISDKIFSGTTYSAIGLQFNVKNKHILDRWF